MADLLFDHTRMFVKFTRGKLCFCALNVAAIGLCSSTPHLPARQPKRPYGRVRIPIIVSVPIL